jgi:hypothetical protein
MCLLQPLLCGFTWGGHQKDLKVSPLGSSGEFANLVWSPARKVMVGQSQGPFVVFGTSSLSSLDVGQ